MNNEQVLAKMLTGIFGKDAWDDDVTETARRVLKMWDEFAPSSQKLENITTFTTSSNQLIIVKDIAFSSMCAHHLLPFWGFAHVGYIPGRFQMGLSKIPRIVDYWAKRPQVQEALTESIADEVKHRVQAMGVACVIESRHTCMACRGIRKHDASMTTSVMKGVFLTADSARMEFLTLIGRATI